MATRQAAPVAVTTPADPQVTQLKCGVPLAVYAMLHDEQGWSDEHIQKYGAKRATAVRRDGRSAGIVRKIAGASLKGEIDRGAGQRDGALFDNSLDFRCRRACRGIQDVRRCREIERQIDGGRSGRGGFGVGIGGVARGVLTASGPTAEGIKFRGRIFIPMSIIDPGGRS